MGVSGSVFIMDVARSSRMSNPTDLTDFLKFTVAWVRAVAARTSDSISLSHRFGDEILLVTRGAEGAYVLAFYIMATWPFPEHLPYFGVGYGDLRTEFPRDEDLEVWNSPVVKQARTAADMLKHEKPANRPWLLFSTDDLATGDLLNEYALIQDRFFRMQTHADHLAAAIYTIRDVQAWVAEKLGKSRSTISRQVRKSNADVIIATKNRVVSVLHELGRLSEDSAGALNPRVLENHIQHELTSRTQEILRSSQRGAKDG
ncbi:hypothetical protein [Alicyclobacillus sp. ALC3]|uniref:hypothetical protein n=1 Tax=Alicyclobacillus sp. ALC3 TaxID=2796143 RepID=UPI0023793E5E|nr:hypothetical protein [Alicyclobacillus sp. ALC3]WDL95332.1 hypothetical protein JC200_13000 [Alicyclobacillus sp. ALC3]